MITEKIVLIFAYHYPPENVIGAARPYRFSRYLSMMGYRCKVFTAAEQPKCSNSLAEYITDPFAASVSRNSTGWHLERAVRKFFFPGALGFQWSLLASRSARSFLSSIRNAEVTVYSTFPPVGAHLAAMLLVRGRPWRWIADFRDPVVAPGNSRRHNWIQQRAHRTLELAMLARADAVVVSNDAQEVRWKTTYPRLEGRIKVIWNGFDPADRIDERDVPKREFHLVSHVGSLYGGRSIRPLLQSVSRLIEVGRLVRELVRIRLVGPVSGECLPDTEFLDQARRDGWLEIIPDHLPQVEARRMAQESDGLLLVQPHSKVQVPGKLFEYLRLKRPVLAFVLRETPIEEILRRSGANYRCVYANDSTRDIDSSVEAFFKQKEWISETNAWFAEKFNAEKQAEELSALIQSVHASRNSSAQARARTVPQMND